MRIVAIVESDDYSGAAVLDPSSISVIQIDDNFFAASKCMFSGIPVTCEISEENAAKLIGRGVELVSTDSLTGPLNEED
jgi:hypothetical protein